jgi:hypothetical protein
MRPLSPVAAQGRSRRVFGAALLSVALLGCAPWARIPAPAPAVLAPPPTLQVWLAGQAILLREVTVTPDSIRGRRVNSATATSATPLALPRAGVDSFRLLFRDTQNSFGAGALLGILIGVAGIFGIFGHSGT